MTPTLKFSLQITAVIMIGLGTVPTVMAQFGASSPNPSSGRDSERRRIESERDLEQRIFNLRMLSQQARQPGPKRPSPQQALAQIQKDFLRLQVLNRNLGRAAIGTNSLDLKFVSKSVSEMKERAERLNNNLALPETQPTTDRKLDLIERPEQVKPSVLRLVKLVFRFVDNPFFKEINVVDAQQTAQARHDLEEIIKLSEQLKKGSEELDNDPRAKVQRP
jgi:hypothetical protein